MDDDMTLIRRRERLVRVTYRLNRESGVEEGYISKGYGAKLGREAVCGYW